MSAVWVRFLGRIESVLPARLRPAWNAPAGTFFFPSFYAFQAYI